MNPLAVWYHTRIEGNGLNPDFAASLMAEQMQRLRDSGLADAAEIFVAVNGDPWIASALAPAKSTLVDNGPEAESHLPTVVKLGIWVKQHPEHYVCYFHAKGVTHPGDAFNRQWRHCMERVVLDGWQRCVKDLENLDSAGAHWLTPEKYGSMVTHPFWGGMFFWARASYLSILPPVPDKPTCRDDWFLSERWIGTGPRRPKVRDYAPHWPSAKDCR